VTRETIVFVHGLWMPGHVMMFLKNRLERDYGYRGRLFSYWSVRDSLDDNAGRLADFAASSGEGPVHLVGHSLGGVLALRMHAQHSSAPPGRVVCLGSPLCGSRAALGLGRHPLGNTLLGRCIADGVLLEAASEWAVPVTESREVGIIAGTLGMGFGRLVATFDEDNDGTVSVSETRLPGARDHLTLPVTHTGLVWSHRVVPQVAAFLRRGVFRREG
jgi:pimeloyl-ACP methyl ester carboxylesterase